MERSVLRSSAGWGRFAVLACLLAAASGCGPGFPGYETLYQEPDAGAPGEPWAGPERVEVALGARVEDVGLDGLTTTDLNGVQAVPLTSLVEAAELGVELARYRYDFTATDDYNLLTKRRSEELLPSWDDMAIGALYRHPDGGLRVAWDPELQPWGSALSAYRVRAMDGGRITLLEAP